MVRMTKNILRLLLASAFLLFIANSAQAEQPTTLASLRQFVAPNGTDSGTCGDSQQPCKSIGYAISQAEEGGEIRVAAGIYKELLQVTKSITLTGGFTTSNWITPTWTTQQAILDGQDAYRPLAINADNVTVDGFFVRNGNTSGVDRIGGGIFIGPVNTVNQATLVNLRVENNVASNFDSGEGGGIAATLGNTFQNPALLILNNVSIISNTASTGNLAASGGGLSIQAVGNSPLNVEMVNVVVAGNTAGNDFSSSGGGIAFSLNGGKATLRQVRILDNRAAQIKTSLGGASRGGGIYLNSGNLQLENVLLAGNFGERGDALSVQPGNLLSATVSMNYVTLANNYRVAADAATIIDSDGSQLFFRFANTLISGNPTLLHASNNAQATSLDFASVLIDNNVSSLSSGTVISNGVPLRGAAGYANEEAGDFHLSATSAAIDKGNNLPPAVDLEGTLRPIGAASDIGAYEFDAARNKVYLPLVVK